ncbi:histidine kinase, partial [Streptomyces rubiginosohelvolus]
MTDEVRGWLTPKAVAAEAGVSQEFDLSQCVREPIHLLGGVQSYGALIAARLHGAVVDTVSRNTGEVLGVAAEELVGRPVTELIGDEQWALAREITEAAGPPEGSAEPGAPEGAPSGPVASGVLSLSLERDGQDRLFDVTVHRVAELLVLEFEPRSAEGPFVFQNFY